MKIAANKTALFLISALSIGLVGYSLAFNAYYWSDDFHTLALVRYIDNPVYLFGNHFPFKLLYRPLGVLYWFLCYQLFGLHPYAYHLLDFLLYVATAYVLWRILADLTGNTLVSGVLACLALAHPVTASTAMWLSTRYDMLSVLFMLLSIRCAIRYTETAGWTWLSFSLLSQVLAILAKELGYITPILLTVVILTFPRNKLGARAKIGSLSLSYLLAIALIVVRYWVLGRLGGGAEGGIPELSKVLWTGFASWLRYLPQNLLYDAGVGILGGAVRVTYKATLLALGISLVLVVLSKRVAQERHLIFLGLALGLSPGLAMAPVTATYPFPTVSENYDLSVMMTSRYFYASLIGFVILVGGIATAIFRSSPIGVRKYLAIALYCVLAGLTGLYAATSRKIAAEWSGLSNGNNRRVIESIAREVSRLDLEPGCKIYVFNTKDALSYLQNYMDVAIKAVSNGDPDLLTCYIQSEKSPIYYLLPTSSAQAETFKPLQPIIAPDFVGDLAFLYLRLPDGEANVDGVVDHSWALYLRGDLTLSNVTDEHRRQRSGERF